jgi:prepilin signal peptidase PulO-like enzyme (type II secretory pathway)
VPFGPYLAAGAVLWLFSGQKILSWYLGLRAGGAEGAGL